MVLEKVCSPIIVFQRLAEDSITEKQDTEYGVLLRDMRIYGSTERKVRSNLNPGLGLVSC